MLIPNNKLFELDGVTPLKAQTRQDVDKYDDLTVARVIVTAALSPPTGQYIESAKSVARYDLALAAYATPVGGTFEIPASLVADIRKDLTKNFGPIIVGQVDSLLAAKPLPKVVEPAPLPELEAPLVE
jgi:hypothetical protein